jgi:hypothetical protein
VKPFYISSETVLPFQRNLHRYAVVMVHVNYHPDKWERMLAIMVGRYTLTPPDP